MISSLQIGAREYKVERVSLAMLADDGRAADVCHRTAVIRIPNEGDAPHIAHLIVHESLHALFDDTGLMIEREEEERLVSVLTPRLAAFLRDNPDQVRELLAMLA